MAGSFGFEAEHYATSMAVGRDRLFPAILAEDAAIPMLHERVTQGEQDGVEGAVRDPRERELITAETAVSE